jgi:rhomboid family GlyGly-CTERM serine protease
VHWSVGHLLANLAGCAVLAWLGLAASLPARCTRAWLLAWPLTHVGLLLLPDLQHYGGLSGVLHAGVAIAVVELLFRQGRDRLLGAAIAAGLLLKLLLEQPFGAAMRQVPGWDIAVVPFAHLSGAIAGLACALLLSINWQGRSVNQ